jgi:hypothetical protein
LDRHTHFFEQLGQHDLSGGPDADFTRVDDDIMVQGRTDVFFEKFPDEGGALGIHSVNVCPCLYRRDMVPHGNAYPLTFGLETFKHHVRGIHRPDVQGTTLRADIGQMMAVKFVATLAPQQGVQLVQSQPRAFDKRTADLHDVKAEPDVVSAVARKGVKTDFHPFYPTGFLRGGLFFNCVYDGADKGGFMHTFYLF